MAHERDKIATELLAMAEKLTRIALAMNEKKPVITVPKPVLEEVAKKIAAGKCLQCDKVKQESYRRGICAACYRRTVLQIDDHATSWGELETAGLAVAKNQGRRAAATELDRLLAEKKKEQGRAALQAKLKPKQS